MGRSSHRRLARLAGAAAASGLALAGLVVASPANPTGTMLEPAELAALARHCAETGVRLISDEIYHGVTYTGLTSSSWETDRSGFVVNSFSKYFSMTGWRIGWLLVPNDCVDVLDALAGNLAICPPAPAQFAALGAFGEPLRDAFPFSAYVSKTITLRPRAGNPPPRLWEAPAGMINSIGLPNKGLHGYLAEDLPVIAGFQSDPAAGASSLPVPVITNVMGSTADELAELVEATAAWVGSGMPVLDKPTKFQSRDGRF